MKALKEFETQKLRERQQRFKDKQADEDERRAKKVLEDAERKLRKKEKDEILLKQRKIEELIEQNAIQLVNKAKISVIEKEKEKIFSEKVVERQLKDIENEKKITEQRKLNNIEYGHSVK